MVGEEGAGEGEVAVADEEDCGGGGEGDDGGEVGFLDVGFLGFWFWLVGGGGGGRYFLLFGRGRVVLGFGDFLGLHEAAASFGHGGRWGVWWGYGLGREAVVVVFGAGPEVTTVVAAEKKMVMADMQLSDSGPGVLVRPAAGPGCGKWGFLCIRGPRAFC